MENLAKDVHIVKQNFSFDIKLLHSGIETETANAYPQTIDRYVFNYVTAGCGQIAIGGKTFPFGTGDVFIIPANTEFYQVNSLKTPYKYYYIALYGPDAGILFEKAQLSSKTPVLKGAGETVRQKTEQIFQLLENNSFLSVAKANVLFFEILLALYEKNAANHIPQNKNSEYYVENCLLYIEKNYSRKISVSDISKKLHVDRTHLATVFKKEYGMTLKEYLTKYRIGKVMYLLQNTDFTINKIMLAAGFSDYANFYKTFKKQVGISPRLYRTNNDL